MRVFCAIINIFLALTFLVWPTGFFISVHVIDATGASLSFLQIAFVVSIWIYPILVIVGNMIFWIKRKSAKPGSFGNYTLISLLGPALVILFFMLLELVEGGIFAGN